MDAEGQPALSIHAFDLRRVVRRLIGQCSANLLRRTKSVIVVMHTIGGFCGPRDSSSFIALRRHGRQVSSPNPAFQHRPGTAKVRPKRESIAEPFNGRCRRQADIGDRESGHLNWADIALTGATRGRTGAAPKPPESNGDATAYCIGGQKASELGRPSK